MIDEKENKILTSESTKEIYAALAKAQAEFGHAKMSGENKHHNYKYAKLSDFIEATQIALGKHDLGLNFNTIYKKSLPERKSTYGKPEYVIEVKMSLRIFHTSGEWIEVSGYGEGQDQGDKSYYKAVTGCRKYLIASALNLATEDDPENDSDDKKPEPKEPAPRQPANTKPATKPNTGAPKREYEAVPKGESKTIVGATKKDVELDIPIPYPAENLSLNEATAAYIASLEMYKGKDKETFMYVWIRLYKHAKDTYKIGKENLDKFFVKYKEFEAGVK